MFFKRKTKKQTIHCKSCSHDVEKKFSFCPHCGNNLIDHAKEEQDFGLIGKTDSIFNDQFATPFSKTGLGITDRMISSIFNKLMKSLEKEVPGFGEGEIEELPNGIRIQFGIRSAKPMPQKRKEQVRGITREQIERMSSLPRATAKSSVKRLNNKLVYELATPGIQTVDDIIFSKTESGYEIKAIGKSKVYVSNIPISLPLRKIFIDNNKTFIEFASQ